MSGVASEDAVHLGIGRIEETTGLDWLSTQILASISPALGLPYLFKLRHTAKVKELVVRMMRQGALWQDCGDGWEAMETTLRLSGWSRERRVILVRESPARTPVRERGKSRRGKDRQTLLPNAKGDGWKTPKRLCNLRILRF